MSGRCLFVLLAAMLFVGPLRAAEPPPDLPRYDMRIQLDPANRRVHLVERVTWTNRSVRPTNELVFAVYPLYKVPDDQVAKLAKTIEVLRQAPSEALALDPAATVPKAKLCGNNQPLPTMVKHDNQTALIIPLPMMIQQGQSVSVELDYEMQLPEKEGRWGVWQNVLFICNWHPTLCVYDDKGWQPQPFIPWHQPFFNESGYYTATIILPKNQVLAAPTAVVEERDRGDGWKQVTLAPAVLRDFALVCSERFQTMEAVSHITDNGSVVESQALSKKPSNGLQQVRAEAPTGPQQRDVKVRVVYLPEHAHYAEVSMRVACEALPVYSAWFGAYPYSQFTIVESFFPWNGNECAGMVWLDHRIFQLPTMAEAYVDYLVSHEIAHQWWYSVIGTNGYAETFMDEGPATYFSHRLIDRKLGKNNDLIKYPNGLGWMPNIKRENYRWGNWMASVRRGEAGPAVQPIDQYLHVYDLFSGAYDRGSRIFAMIEEKLGEAAFMDFIRHITRKYAFRILRVADFQRELEEYTGRPWKEFFDQWVYGRGLTDWRVDTVQNAGTNKYEIRLKQTREIDEPTVLGIKLGEGDGYTIRVPVNPRAGTIKLDQPNAEITPAGEHEVIVRVSLPSEPTQVTVDPDGLLLDADPSNNNWHTNAEWRFTPLYTQLDDVNITNDYNRWNIHYGPWVYAATSRDPWYARTLLAGFRVGAVRMQEFSGGAFAAYRSDYRDFVVGADGFIDHLPWPKTQFGFHIEKRIGGPIGTEGPNDVTRAVVYGRYVFDQTSATYLNPMQYAEVFTTYQDNAMPYTRRPQLGVRWDNSTTVGIHYSINYLTPYWDPEAGYRADITYQGGTVDINGQQGTQRVDGQFTYIKTPPSSLGWLSETRLGVRVAGAAAWPDDGLFYALGGSTLFRGFDLAERQGNTFWVTNFEWRIPLVRHMEWDVCDHLAGLRGIYLAPFYDVGAIYVDGVQVSNVAHAVGIGLRWDIAWFSFIERSMIRFDVAKTINESSPVQFWIGFMHTF